MSLLVEIITAQVHIIVIVVPSLRSKPHAMDTERLNTERFLMEAKVLFQNIWCCKIRLISWRLFLRRRVITVALSN